MKKHGLPHALSNACVASGITLADLSEMTGIPEDELRGFDNGTHALSATDHLGILLNLGQCAPHDPRPMSDLHFALLRYAYERLEADADEEERERDAMP